MAQIVTYGEAMALVLAEPAEPTALSPTYSRQTVGAEANVAVGLARLGNDVAWFGRVGDDDLGAAVLRDLRAEGVEVSHAVADPDRPTGIIVRDQIPGRATSVSYHRRGSAGAALEAADVPHRCVAAAAFLHVTGITPMLSASALDATVAAVGAARGNGVAISLDPNIRLKLAPLAAWAATLEPFLDCEVILAGEAEARALHAESQRPLEAEADPTHISPHDEVPAAELMGWLHDRGARTVVLKQGREGAMVSSAGPSGQVDAVATVEVDAVGAGDAFAAGYLSATVGGADPMEAIRQGAVVAAMSVQGRGDWVASPTTAPYPPLGGDKADVDRGAKTKPPHNTPPG
jgi:2-dehydro-3-deoxygluconokinase